LDPNKNLTSQCVQGCGQVQVNVEIKTVLGGMPRINITDVLKPADSDDEDLPPPGNHICILDSVCFCAKLETLCFYAIKLSGLG
jgi:GA-binding protein alpha chain